MIEEDPPNPYAERGKAIARIGFSPLRFKFSVRRWTFNVRTRLAIDFEVRCSMFELALRVLRAFAADLLPDRPRLHRRQEVQRLVPKPREHHHPVPGSHPDPQVSPELAPAAPATAGPAETPPARAPPPPGLPSPVAARSGRTPPPLLSTPAPPGFNTASPVKNATGPSVPLAMCPTRKSVPPSVSKGRLDRNRPAPASPNATAPVTAPGPRTSTATEPVNAPANAPNSGATLSVRLLRAGTPITGVVRFQKNPAVRVELPHHYSDILLGRVDQRQPRLVQSPPGSPRPRAGSRASWRRKAPPTPKAPPASGHPRTARTPTAAGPPARKDNRPPPWRGMPGPGPTATRARPASVNGMAALTDPPPTSCRLTCACC